MSVHHIKDLFNLNRSNHSATNHRRSFNLDSILSEVVVIGPSSGPYACVIMVLSDIEQFSRLNNDNSRDCH